MTVSAPQSVAVKPVVQPPKVVLALHDAGETVGLQPLMQHLEASGQPYAILCDTTAQRLLANTPYQAHEIPWQQALKQPGNLKAQALLSWAMTAPTLITGTVSDMQAFWASCFKQAGHSVVAYYDSLTLPGKLPAPLKALQPFVHAWLSPSRQTATWLKQWAPQAQSYAVGSPKTQARPLSATQQLHLRKQLGLAPQEPVVLWIGGYGPHYPESFQLMLNSFQALGSKATLLVAPHPKKQGALEKQSLAPFAQHKIKLVQDVPTQALLSLATVVCTQESSMMLEALSLGKKALFVGQPVDAQAVNLLERVAPRVLNPKQLSQVLETSLNPAPSRPSTEQELKQQQTQLAQRLSLPTRPEVIQLLA